MIFLSVGTVGPSFANRKLHIGSIVLTVIKNPIGAQDLTNPMYAPMHDLPFHPQKKPNEEARKLGTLKQSKWPSTDFPKTSKIRPRVEHKRQHFKGPAIPMITQCLPIPLGHMSPKP
ncbi:hypothetical protein VNO77_41974 [Canavalia gladiata]|uniref:Uncharacterized protein n=1 Tax=Canavalia gladiata TaxID=3824 RepID=A0AAN9K1X3_CANGL